jgi:EAL domain-containing protein (putative c-di-GMP-specific phosphodiesterase class I)/ActR/RegA family two-component response regulator
MEGVSLTESFATPAQRILIIDDDLQIATGLAVALERRGRHIIVCRDIESAELVSERFDLTHVITDIKLTGPFRFEGLEIVDRVKRQHQTANVIVISGHVTEELRAEAHRRGAGAVLGKPFSVDRIERLIPAPSADIEGIVTFVPMLDEILHGDLITSQFQPIVWTENPKYAVGFEALTRLRSDSLLSDPVLLFRYAAAKGRVVDLELATATSSLAAGRELAELGILSVNVHPDVFLHADRFFHGIMDACADAELAPQRVVLEITEQAPLRDLSAVEAVSAVMRSHGFHFAFDDVGSAYSHLRAIAAVRPSYLKISQHFGTGCEESEANRKIIENVEALARSFSSEVVLEGVETEPTAAFARQLGIRFGQGYLYSRPTDTKRLMEEYSHH